MNTKIESEVYVKRFGKKLKIEKAFKFGDEEAKYIYQIGYEKDTYILKGFTIEIEHIDPEDERSGEFFVKSLGEISEILQEYHFARAASLINPHIAKPLYLDFTVNLAKDKTSPSYLHIQIIFEYGGVALSNLQPTTIKQTYNLMRQSANALLSLHNLEIAHLDIKPDNMVYDAKKDLLKIIDMGSAFGGSNRKKFEATTTSLEGKVRSATSEFAPPEVLFMEKGSTKELNLDLSLTAIDVYCWAMSFFTILTNKSTIDLQKYSTKYKTRLESNYKGFIKIVETAFNSIKSNNFKEPELMRVVSNLLTKALQYKPKERPTIKDIIREMRKFESEKKYVLNYSKTEPEHGKEMKIQSPMLDKIADSSVELSCGDEVDKDCLVKYTLELFIQGNPYEHNCFCETCGEVQKLKSFPLSCGCIWTMPGKKIKYNSDLTKASYGECDKGHPLTSIDLGLVNDFVSLKFTSLMITDYPQEKKELVNSFNSSVREENLEDIAWILRYSKAITKLYLYYNKIEDKGAKAIGEALKANTTLTELDLSNNEIGVEGGKVIGEVFKTNKTLTILIISSNNIKDECMKTISELLKINTTLKELDLSSNEITDKGIRIICEALKVNTRLKKLNLQHNKLGAEGKNLLKKVKEKYKHIEIIY